MTIRTIWVKGEVPYTKNFGTLAELLALVPSTEFAEGFASDYGRIDWSKGAGRWMSGGRLLSSDGTIVADAPIVARKSIIGANSRRLMQPIFGCLPTGVWTQMASGSNTTGYTFCQKFFCKSPFNALRVVLVNPFASSLTISNIAISATDKAGASTMLSPVTPTLNGASMAGAVVPAATGISVGNGCLINDGYLRSDWMPISSVARTDGGTWYGADMRVFIPSGVSFGWRNTTFGTANNFPTTVGNEMGGILRPNDHVGTNDSCNYTNSSDWGVIGYIEFATVDAGYITILESGDSLAKGHTGGGSGSLGPLSYAMTTNPKIGGICYGVGGTKSNYWQPRARDLAPKVKPQSMIVAMWTPNEAISQWKNSFVEAQETVETALSLGIIPIIRTPYPCNYSSTNLASWIALRDAVRDFASRLNLPLADYALATEDPANPGQWASGMTDDASYIHPSSVGVQAAAARIAVAVSGLLT